jgi:hypothetical protein
MLQFLYSRTKIRPKKKAIIYNTISKDYNSFVQPDIPVIGNYSIKYTNNRYVDNRNINIRGLNPELESGLKLIKVKY